MDWFFVARAITLVVVGTAVDSRLLRRLAGLGAMNIVVIVVVIVV